MSIWFTEIQDYYLKMTISLHNEIYIFEGQFIGLEFRLQRLFERINIVFGVWASFGLN